MRRCPAETKSFDEFRLTSPSPSLIGVSSFFTLLTARKILMNLFIWLDYIEMLFFRNQEPLHILLNFSPDKITLDLFTGLLDCKGV